MIFWRTNAKSLERVTTTSGHRPTIAACRTQIPTRRLNSHEKDSADLRADFGRHFGRDDAGDAAPRRQARARKRQLHPWLHGDCAVGSPRVFRRAVIPGECVGGTADVRAWICRRHPDNAALESLLRGYLGGGLL